MRAFVQEINPSVGPQLTLLVLPEEYVYPPFGALIQRSEADVLTQNPQ